MAERCELTELVKIQCAHCLGHTDHEEEDNVEFFTGLTDRFSNRVSGSSKSTERT